MYEMKKIEVVSEETINNILIIGNAVINNVPITFFVRKTDDNFYESIIYELLTYTCTDNLKESLFNIFTYFTKEAEYLSEKFEITLKEYIQNNMHILWLKKIHKLFVLFHLLEKKPVYNYEDIKKDILNNFKNISSLNLYNVENIE